MGLLNIKPKLSLHHDNSKNSTPLELDLKERITPESENIIIYYEIWNVH